MVCAGGGGARSRRPLGVGALALAASLCVVVLAREGLRAAGSLPDPAGIVPGTGSGSVSSR